MGFVVINSKAQLKLNMGATFPDPVTVPHGGTGQSTYSHGDILYGSATAVISKLARDDGGVRVLSNLGTSNNPHWDDPDALSLAVLPIARHFASSEWPRAATAAQDVTWTSSLTDSNTGAFTADATDTWRTFNILNSTGSVSGWRTSANICWLDNNPKLIFKFRTGASVANIRYWFIISNATAVLSNSDDQHALKGVGLRFSTAAGDAGFVPWTADGTTQTIGSSILALATNTVYTITISVSGSTVSYTINASTGTASVPSGALATGMRSNIEGMALSNNARVFDLGVVYGEWD